MTDNMLSGLAGAPWAHLDALALCPHQLDMQAWARGTFLPTHSRARTCGYSTAAGAAAMVSVIKPIFLKIAVVRLGSSDYIPNSPE